MTEYIIDRTQIRKDRNKRSFYIIVASIIFFVVVSSSKKYDLQSAFVLYSMIMAISILFSVFDNKITKIRIDTINQNLEYHFKNKIWIEKSRTVGLLDISSTLSPKRKSFWQDHPELIVYNKKTELFKIKSDKGYSFEVLEEINQIIDGNGK